MALRITTRQDKPPVTVEDDRQLDEVLDAASAEARTGKVLGAVLIEADNGNAMTMVVGGEDTVFSFDYGHRNSP